MSKSLLSLSRLIQSSICKCQRLNSTQICSTGSLTSKWHGLWEPNDLKLEPDIPEFKQVQIRLKGYDYPTLESYAKYVHRAVTIIFNGETDAWPSPAKNIQACVFHAKSTVVAEKFDLRKYERAVMAENVPTTSVPLILEFIRKNCPEGVEVTLREPDKEEDEFRYVPDYDILQLQAQREVVASGKLAKSKK